MEREKSGGDQDLVALAESDDSDWHRAVHDRFIKKAHPELAARVQRLLRRIERQSPTEADE